MGSPAIFSGKRTKLLTTKGILNSDTSINDNDGVLNYIKNGHAEVNALGWATYADAAGVLPVDGTGGTPTHITFTQTSTAPLGGLGSFLVTNSGSTSAQGEGASYNFTIDAKDQAKVLQINFDYLLNSGTFVAGSSGVDSDLEVYIYDVTNALIFQPSSYKLLSNSTTIADKFAGTFQTASNSTSYRLILHCPTTATAAWSIKLDNVTVSPSQYVYGSPVTDFVAVSTGNVVGTTSGSLAIGTGGGAIYSVQAKRIGDEAHVKYVIRVGTSGASDVVGAYQFPFPTGMTPATFNLNETIGYGDVTVVGTVNPAARLICKNYSTGFVVDVSDGGLLSAGGVLFTNANVVNMTIRYKVQGWSSNVQMSDSADTRVVDFIGAQSSQAVTANVTNIAFTTTKDSHGLWTGSTYVVGIPGDYNVNSSWSTLLSATGGIYKNGSLFSFLSTAGAATVLAGAAVVPCIAGDIISVRSSVSTTVSSGALGIFKISGPSAIAAIETVAASYWLSANFTSSATIPVNFDSREYDTHGAVTTSATAWKFTAPASGLFLITGFLQQVSAAAGSLAITLYKNGSAYKIFALQNGTITGSNATLNLRLIAGDYIDIRSSVSQAYIGGSLATAYTGHVEITRVGN